MAEEQARVVGGNDRPTASITIEIHRIEHSAHLGYFRRLPLASDIRLGRNGQFWDICDAARMNTGVNRQAEGRHSAR